ncbi:MAG: hypothetical protein WC515_08425 [Candidatus Omnitrophota bacterium]
MSKNLKYALSAAVFIASCAVPYVWADTDADDEMMFDEGMAQVEMGGRIVGQVVKVNPASKTMTIRDMRYDSKVVTIMANSDTTYFGTTSIKTINPGDYLSVDCISINDTYVADNVVMQERAMADETMPALEKVLVD